MFKKVTLVNAQQLTDIAAIIQDFIKHEWFRIAKWILWQATYVFTSVVQYSANTHIDGPENKSASYQNHQKCFVCRWWTECLHVTYIKWVRFDIWRKRLQCIQIKRDNWTNSSHIKES
jgi:hypothetical protein